jgi:hypothetical protein
MQATKPKTKPPDPMEKFKTSVYKVRPTHANGHRLAKRLMRDLTEKKGDK